MFIIRDLSDFGMCSADFSLTPYQHCFNVFLVLQLGMLIPVILGNRLPVVETSFKLVTSFY